MTVFWYVAPRNLVEVYQCFRGAHCLHHQATGCNVPEDSHLHAEERRTKGMKKIPSEELHNV
jgi:hypothetical protein